MSISSDQAAALMTLLDCATDGNWMNTIAQLQDRQCDPADIRGAWLALEEHAGMDGCVPDLEEFDPEM